MDQTSDALSEFMELTRALVGTPETDQIEILKYRLLETLSRAAEWRDRATSLERALDLAADQAAERVRSHDDELRLLQGKTRDLETRRHALEELCRDLLLTIERAACAEAPIDLQRAVSAGEGR